MKRLLVLGLLLPLVYISPVRADVERGETASWLNFDGPEQPLPAAENCSVAVSADSFAGAGCLTITPPEPMKKVARVTFTLPDSMDLTSARALKMQLRTTPTEESVSFRWLALAQDGETLLQRRFSFDKGAVWSEQEFPLALWRWGNLRCGDWSEVRQLQLVIESRVAEVRLDEIEVETGQPYARPELIDEIAFGTDKPVVSERNGFRLSSNAGDALHSADVERIHARFGPIPVWLRRVFGEAVRPLNETPIQVLVFATREDYIAFSRRLGLAWRVSIAPPEAGGYAVQDIASSYLDKEQGVDRPVFFHETIHATAARLLRLVPGSAAHSWLQEGLANYLQLCLFPDSLGLETYPRLFKEGVGEKTYFKPLENLLSERVEMRHYAQLASLAAWLVEKHSDWLATIATSLADGGKLESALEDCETSIADMQQEWLKWGREKFPEGTKPKHHFDKPAEWDAENKQPGD